mmetsp:Transcript_45060/g.71989  ORF Transcript_45060/g.71989 Transcript_45060/m.71989 type:complete len:95 (-) Transcript_45060:175-459(-)
MIMVKGQRPIDSTESKFNVSGRSVRNRLEVTGSEHSRYFEEPVASDWLCAVKLGNVACSVIKVSWGSVLVDSGLGLTSAAKLYDQRLGTCLIRS